MNRWPQREYAEYVELSKAYFDKIESEGDQPWFHDDMRRAKVAAQLGLPADADAETVRLALFERGRRR